MKYIIFKSNILKHHEIAYRKEYIYECFQGVYRIDVKEFLDRFELNCFSIYKNDLVFIIGHDISVKKYLLKNKYITAKHLLIISCISYDFVRMHKLRNVKNIYLANTVNNKVTVLDGQDYGFEFPITDSEINLYKLRNEKLKYKLNNSFKKEK